MGKSLATNGRYQSIMFPEAVNSEKNSQNVEYHTSPVLVYCSSCRGFGLGNAIVPKMTVAVHQISTTKLVYCILVLFMGMPD